MSKLNVDNLKKGIAWDLRRRMEESIRGPDLRGQQGEAAEVLGDGAWSGRVAFALRIINK